MKSYYMTFHIEQVREDLFTAEFRNSDGTTWLGTAVGAGKTDLEAVQKCIEAFQNWPSTGKLVGSNLSLVVRTY